MPPGAVIAAALTVGIAVLLLWLLTDVQFDSQGDVTLMQYSLAINEVANAIATAEGFGKDGAIPTLAHNPGDLVIPHWAGPSMGKEHVSVFKSDDEGWNRLRHQLQLIADNRSKVYNLDMTIQEMANKWTRTDPTAWAETVASNVGIGITSDVPLRAILLHVG